MKIMSAWKVVGLFCLIIIGLGLFALIPLFGIISYLVLPSAVLLLCAATVNAFLVTFLPIQKIVYFCIGASVLVFLTWYGLYLRDESDRQGSIGVYSETKIEHPVVAELREEVFLDSKKSISYDRAMFDTIQPIGGDSWTVESLDWYRSPVSVAPKDLLDRIGVEPVPYPNSRIKILITQTEHGERTEINAQVIDGELKVANLKTSLPSSKRQPYSSMPRLLRYAIENNPIVLAISPPRKYVDGNFLSNFLTSAIQLNKKEVVPIFDINATELTSEDIFPAIKVDRTDPIYSKWWAQSEDERCYDLLKVQTRSWVGDKFVIFEASPQQKPKIRLQGEKLICAGGAVYLQRYGRVPPNVLDISRYNLKGDHTADIRIKLPNHAVTTFIAYEMQSFLEHDGKLTFTVRNVRFEWAEDQGNRIRKSDGDLLEYAIIDRRSDYEVALPKEAQGL